MSSSTLSNFKDMPSSGIFGFDFALSSGTSTISFNSTLAPVWGDFFAANSTGTSYAYDTGFGTSATPSNTTNWIPIAGSVVTSVPEPTTLLLLSTCFGMIFLGRSKKLFPKL
jgi:hypothetical protein